MSNHHDDDLTTLDPIDLEHVSGGAAASDGGMSMMLPMMMMMKKGHGGAQAAPSPPPAPTAPLMPKIIVNGVEQTPQTAGDGSLSYSS